MSKPTFNFGSAGSNGSGSLFGQTSGSSQTPSTTAASNPFGTSAGIQQGNMFGGSTSQPTSTPSLFGSTTATAGGQKPLTFGSNPTSGTSTPAFGSSFNFGRKPDEKNDTSTSTPDKTATTTQAQQVGLFGGGSTSSTPSIFGSSTPATSAPVGSTTPATTKPGGLFNFTNSTTPAGPPPSENNTGSKPAGIGLFGSTQPSTGGIFGPKSADSTSKPTTTSASGLFGAGTSSGASTSFSVPTSAASSSGSGLFAGLNAQKPTASDSSTSAAPVPAPNFSTTKPAFNFGSNTSSSIPQATPASTTTTAGTGSFSSTPASASITTTSAPAKATSIFGSATPATTSTPNTSSAPPPSLFSGLGKLGANPVTTVPASSSAAATTPDSHLFAPKTSQATANPAPGASLFAAKQGENTTGTTPSTAAPGASATATTTATAGTSSQGVNTSTTLGASTAGPAPQMSRLKNKTMDEIITRWATDLSTYQKEFQSQAIKVASWDRLLVDNGEKIQKLYTSTFEAERASAEVERQLASVESQQDELTAWLDHYEREVNDMFVKQVGPGESLQGPDQERERTYKLAEKLTDRLDEMGKDLTSMIQEINNASATLTKTSKPDDPLSQIVRVLNEHLSQLQWIDQNAAALQTKIAAAQKASQSIASNGYGSAENDAADSFYRSYMGRR